MDDQQLAQALNSLQKMIYEDAVEHDLFACDSGIKGKRPIR